MGKACEQLDKSIFECVYALSFIPHLSAVNAIVSAKGEAVEIGWRQLESWTQDEDASAEPVAFEEMADKFAFKAL